MYTFEFTLESVFVSVWRIFKSGAGRIQHLPCMQIPYSLWRDADSCGREWPYNEQSNRCSIPYPSDSIYRHSCAPNVKSAPCVYIRSADPVPLGTRGGYFGPRQRKLKGEMYFKFSKPASPSGCIHRRAHPLRYLLDSEAIF